MTGVLEWVAVTRTALLGLAGGLLALVAACGGGVSPYSAEKTQACLKENPTLRIGSDVDFVASTALGGAFHVRLPGNQVTISFGADRETARSLTQAYKRFKGKNIGLEDVLKVEKNAVMLWEAHPEPPDLATIHDCLK